MFRVSFDTQIVNGAEHYDAHMLSHRGDHEVVVGVFRFHPAEWEPFQDWCAAGNIEITYEPKRAKISA